MKERIILKAVLIGMICVLSVGCSSMNKYEATDTNIKVEYVNAEYKVVSRPDLPQRVIVQFNIIPGAIWGNPLTDSQYLDVIEIGNTLNANFAELLGKIKSFATPTLNTGPNEGLEIVPKETKIARFGTFTYDLETRDSLGGTGFGSPDPNIHALVLAYFDRPAQLTGVQTVNGDTTEYSIDVKNEGLVWLRLERLKPTHYVFKVHEMTGNEFLFIRPPKPLYEET